jgi:DNA-binding XRE family transcriptional regulator
MKVKRLTSKLEHVMMLRSVFPSELGRVTGVGRHTITAWMENRSEPKITEALLIMEYLRVPRIQDLWTATYLEEDEEGEEPE